MDIARIRKKLKETKASDTPSIVNSQETEDREVPSVEHHEKDSELQTPNAELREAEAEIEQEAGIIELLTFSLLREEFAFRVSEVEEILRYQVITVVPRMPPYVSGITSLRGKIIPVIDLKNRLLLKLKGESSDIDRRRKILILKGPKGSIGVTIDRITGIVRLSRSGIIPPPSHLTETELKFIEGVAIVDKRFIPIINMEEALAINLK